MFIIQAGNPRVKKCFEADSDNLREAIEDVFEINSEQAVLLWNYIPVLICYKYDLSVNIDDIIKMLSSIRLNESSEMDIFWPSSTFHCIWKMKWDADMIYIDAKWLSVVGETLSLLNEKSRLVIEKAKFCSEWKKLLENIINGLSEYGSPDKLDGMKALVKEYEHLQDYGEYYS